MHESPGDFGEDRIPWEKRRAKPMDAKQYLRIPPLPHTVVGDLVEKARGFLHEVDRTDFKPDCVEAITAVRDARELLDSVGPDCMHEVLRVEGDTITCCNYQCGETWKVANGTRQ